MIFCNTGLSASLREAGQMVLLISCQIQFSQTCRFELKTQFNCLYICQIWLAFRKVAALSLKIYFRCGCLTNLSDNHLPSELVHDYSQQRMACLFRPGPQVAIDRDAVVRS